MRCTTGTVAGSQRTLKTEMQVFADVTVEIDAKHSAHLESWLLGQGRIPGVLPDHLPGRVRYLVKEARPGQDTRA